MIKDHALGPGEFSPRELGESSEGPSGDRKTGGVKNGERTGIN